MAVDLHRRVLTLIDEALTDLARPDVSTSVILNKAIRIARLRRDAENLVWLLMEARTTGDEEAKKRAQAELLPYYPSREALHAAWSEAVEGHIALRTVDPATRTSEEVLAMSVREVETHIEGLGEMADDAQPGSGMTRSEAAVLADSRSKLLLRRSQVRAILGRIHTRLHDHLSSVEQEVIVDQLVSSIFEEQRIYVDQRLREVAPPAFEQLAAAYARRAAGDREALSHALTSCRRALKSVADALYPADGKTVIGSDGKERKMTEDRYISRLLQFAYETSRGSTGRLIQAQLEELAGKLEALNDLDSKGVHASVVAFEANQAIIQTYLTIGDVLRAADAGEQEPE